MSDQKTAPLGPEELRYQLEVHLKKAVSAAKSVFPFTAYMASIALLAVKEEKAEKLAATGR
jgi:hypothetical protein